MEDSICNFIRRYSCRLKTGRTLDVTRSKSGTEDNSKREITSSLRCFVCIDHKSRHLKKNIKAQQNIITKAIESDTEVKS